MFPSFVQEMVDQFNSTPRNLGPPNLLELFATLKQINHPCSLVGRKLAMCVSRDDFSRIDEVWAIKLGDEVFSETAIAGWDNIARSYVRGHSGQCQHRWDGEEYDLGNRLPSVGGRQLELVEIGKTLQAHAEKEMIMNNLPKNFKPPAQKVF